MAAPPAAAAAAEPGVSATRILLGATAPLSGPAFGEAAVARGAEAYLRFVNARGGVHGRTLVLRVLDDAADPARAAEATRRLVEQEGVFAVFGSVGTAAALAVRSYLNGARVPQLFAASGATSLGRDHRRAPWTLGFRPAAEAEGRTYGAYLARSRPRARVAVLWGDDDEGRELLAGLRAATAGSRVTVAAEPYEAAETDLRPSLARLRATGADTLALFAGPQALSPVAAALGRLAWRPQLVLPAALGAAPILARAGGRTLEGAVSLAFLKDPTDSRWAGDPSLALLRSILARHAPGANPRDVRHVQGMAAAYALVRVLRAAGRHPTRASVLAQARALTDASNPFLVPGIVVRTGAGDGFPVEQALLQRRVGGRWQSFGGLWSLRGR